MSNPIPLHEKYLAACTGIGVDIHYSNIGWEGGVSNPKWLLISKQPVPNMTLAL